MPLRRRRSFKEDLKDVFSMHRGERRGMAVLIALCVIAAGWVTWEQWIKPRIVDEAELKVAWAELQDTARNTPQGHERDHVELFAFNPNHLPTEQWMQLGLSERQAASIHRYEAKGGQFRTKSELARMRVVDPDLYAQWAPYIQLPDSFPRRKRKEQFAHQLFRKDSTGRHSLPRDEANRRTSAPVELNSADSTALVAVRGIGPAFARAILRYRDRLGGFINIGQLSEVHLLRDKPDAVERLKAALQVDASLVRKINVNTCTAEELGPHPYAGWKLAKALVAYRRQHGAFAEVGAIKGCALVTDSVLQRLGPYLEVP